LQTNEAMLMPTDTSGSCDNGMKRSTFGFGGQRSRSRVAKDRLGGMAEAPCLTSFGRVGFHVLIRQITQSHTRYKR